MVLWFAPALNAIILSVSEKRRQIVRKNKFGAIASNLFFSLSPLSHTLQPFILCLGIGIEENYIESDLELNILFKPFFWGKWS